MSLSDLNFHLQATAASATKATVAITATAAAAESLKSSKVTFESSQSALVDSVLNSKTTGSGAENAPAILDIAATMRRLLDVIAAMNDPKTSAFQRVNERIAAKSLIDLLQHFGGDVIRKIDFNALLNPGVKPGARKTTLSKSSGSTTTDLSTAVAQGKMGW